LKKPACGLEPPRKDTPQVTTGITFDNGNAEYYFVMPVIVFFMKKNVAHRHVIKRKHQQPCGSYIDR
jgi:hypothetical protein